MKNRPVGPVFLWVGGFQTLTLALSRQRERGFEYSTAAKRQMGFVLAPSPAQRERAGVRAIGKV
jgi:hypothetical protein